MRGIYFFKKTCDNIFFQYKNKNNYLQDRRRLVSISWTLSRIYFFPISVMVHFRIFSFTSVTIAITSGPSGRVGRLVVRPCRRPWVGPSRPALAGIPLAASRLAPPRC